MTSVFSSFHASALEARTNDQSADTILPNGVSRTSAVRRLRSLACTGNTGRRDTVDITLTSHVVADDRLIENTAAIRTPFGVTSSSSLSSLHFCRPNGYLSYNSLHFIPSFVDASHRPREVHYTREASF